MPHLGFDAVLPMWQTDSSLSHPSVLSAKAFVIDHPDGTVTFLHEAEESPEGIATLGCSLMCLIGATEALNELTPGKPWAAAIDAGLVVLRAGDASAWSESPKG